MDTRCKNVNWCIPRPEQGRAVEHVIVAVLMDIRDELQAIRAVLDCPNFRGMPNALNRTRTAVEGLRRDTRNRKTKNRSARSVGSARSLK